jgi:hypothetical protein
MNANKPNFRLQKIELDVPRFLLRSRIEFRFGLEDVNLYIGNHMMKGK